MHVHVHVHVHVDVSLGIPPHTSIIILVGWCVGMNSLDSSGFQECLLINQPALQEYACSLVFLSSNDLVSVINFVLEFSP